jgi:predicted membrane GTPase involved in stress response
MDPPKGGPPKSTVYSRSFPLSRVFRLHISVCLRGWLHLTAACFVICAIRRVPPRLLNLDQAIEFIKEDEFVEVTPKSIRLRTKILKANQR